MTVIYYLKLLIKVATFFTVARHFERLIHKQVHSLKCVVLVGPRRTSDAWEGSP